MHRISYLQVENFRACKNVSLPLEGYTPLVGQNNTGKSTILEAISWVLKPSSLKASDFADIEKPVVVTACIEGITREILEQIPTQSHQKAIEPYCAGGTFWIQCSGEPGKKPVQKIFNIEAYKGEGIPLEWRTYPTGIPQAVSALLPEALHIAAMDDIGEDLGKSKAGTTIKGLLDEIMAPVLEAHDELNVALGTIRNILSVEGENRSGHLKEFDEQATKTLENFFPGLTLDLDLQVVEIKEFFKAGDLHVTDNLTGDRRRFDQIGTGAQRAIQMALIRHLAQTRSAKTDNPARRLLLIDEPELYLHPQGIRRLRQALKTLSHAGFQVIFSTHSPMMLSRDNAVDTVIVRKDKENGTIAQKPLRHAVQSALEDAEAQSRTLFELGNLSEIYFSERVVLCEGKTDQRLLPLVYEKIYGYPMELDHTTVVSLGSCNDIPKALPVLKAMGIKVCAIADLDFAFMQARKGALAALPKEDGCLTGAKMVLHEAQQEHQFLLNQNGLPQKSENWSAADIWNLMATHDEGKIICRCIQRQLIANDVWVWSEGCIEHVTGATEKGEDAIIAQEEQLSAMSKEDIEEQMPEFRACFDWVKSV